MSKNGAKSVAVMEDVNKIEDIVNPQVETELSKEEQAMINKAVLDSNNTDKQKKDVMLMNVKDLEAHIKYLKEQMIGLDNEYRSRRKLVDGINGSIAGAQAELSNVRASVLKNNEGLVNELKRQREEVEKADNTLRRLIAENEGLLVANKQKQSSLYEHERNCSAQVFEMKKALDQNQAQWNSREQDIILREKALAEEKEAFYAERESLAPEMARISAIKNENILLLQEVERERLNNRNISLGIESERQIIEEAKLVEASKQKSISEKLANEEKRLREWEQNLKDFDLETRAKSAKADKMIRQFQLEKEASSK